ncbi:hypothetical protein ONZ45_g5417 [Pleurotus djamor]|nr:hypothetical protein ONZ45_g5417 [Pleurotus djamor]
MARPIDPSFAYALDAVKSLLKPVEAGAAVSIFLFGLSTMQVYLYFSRFPKDRWMIKLLSLRLKVTTIYLLQLGQVLAIVHYIYTVSIDWYGRPEKYMVKASPGLYIEVLLGGTISTIVQFFLALRAGRFSDSHIITGTLWILAVASYAFIIAIVVVLYMFSLKEFLNDWNWLVAAGKTISTVLDVAVAVLLCYFLFRERKLALKRTTKMVDRLIVMTLQTGLLTRSGLET